MAPAGSAEPIAAAASRQDPAAYSAEYIVPRTSPWGLGGGGANARHREHPLGISCPCDPDQVVVPRLTRPALCFNAGALGATDPRRQTAASGRLPPACVS